MLLPHCTSPLQYRNVLVRIGVIQKKTWRFDHSKCFRNDYVAGFSNPNLGLNEHKTHQQALWFLQQYDNMLFEEKNGVL